MSIITDIILTTIIEDGGDSEGNHPNADELSSYLTKNYNGASLNKVDQLAGGNKNMQCDVFMSAINHLDIDEFINHFKSIKWECPDRVQLFIKDEWDDVFRIIEVNQPDNT